MTTAATVGDAPPSRADSGGTPPQVGTCVDSALDTTISENVDGGYFPGYLDVRTITVESTRRRMKLRFDLNGQIPGSSAALPDGVSVVANWDVWNRDDTKLFSMQAILSDKHAWDLSAYPKRADAFHIDADFNVTREGGSRLEISWVRSRGPRIPKRFLWSASLDALVYIPPEYATDGTELSRAGFLGGTDLCPGPDQAPTSRGRVAEFPDTNAQRSGVPTTTTTLFPDGNAECDESQLRLAVGELVATDPELQRLGPYDLQNVGCSSGYAKLSLVDKAQTLQGITLLFRYVDEEWRVLNEYGAGLCSTDAAQYGISPEVWDAIGGNDIASC